MDKNAGIIQHILRHIENILKSRKRYGDDFEVFKNDIDYFNSVCMSLVQIGELSNHLTPDFISAHTDVPWKQIVSLRNVVVHGYGTLKAELVWATVREDVPALESALRAITGAIEPSA